MERTMKRLVTWVLLLATLLTTWCFWKLQLLMRPGHVVRVGSWGFGNCEFQVWQRKTATVSEPFATGLFVRRGEGPWQAFLLDFEDLYRPNLVLRSQSNGVAVLRNGRRQWFFDLATEQLHRDPWGEGLTGGIIRDDPPGNWWVPSSNPPPQH